MISRVGSCPVNTRAGATEQAGDLHQPAPCGGPDIFYGFNLRSTCGPHTYNGVPSVQTQALSRSVLYGQSLNRYFEGVVLKRRSLLSVFNRGWGCGGTSRGIIRPCRITVSGHSNLRTLYHTLKSNTIVTVKYTIINGIKYNNLDCGWPQGVFGYFQMA